MGLKSRLGMAVCASLVFSGTPALHAQPAAKVQNVKHIRWVLAHEPVRLFIRAAKKFSQEIQARTNGAIQVEVLTLGEYQKKYAKGEKLTPMDVVRLIRQGRIEMSQTYTTSLGNIDRDMYVLDLPFLFKSYAQARHVLEGKIGTQLLASLDRKNVKGLAFTYSGGYRVIPSDKAITSLAQFKGMKIRTSGSPVAQDTFLAVGAKPIPMSLDDVANAAKQGKIQAAESTPSRYYDLKQNLYSKVLNDTQHSLFLTSIIMSNKFWSTLSAKEQKAVHEAAVVSARLERKESIADAAVMKQDCRRDGIPVVAMPAKMKRNFKAAVRTVYKKYKNYFSKDYVAQIEKTN
jgi:tripartite ATP-independent transporter DctP family solute receptor